MKSLPILTLLSCAISVGACNVERASPGTALTIMTFNVENLFDNRDDPGKDDKAFLALSDKQHPAHVAECELIEVERWRDQCLNWDWSDALVEKKLAVVAKTILQVGDGHGPDIVALQEVENRAILERLRTGYLAEAGYLPAILVEGGDTRGIDVAFLSRLPLVSPAVLHPVGFDADYADREGDTRGILQADFRLPDGAVLTGFSVHFPAPFHPLEMRVSAYEKLNALLSALPPDRHVFAAGDFNTTAAEDAAHGVLDSYAKPHWMVSNDGCEGCPGTQYYAPDDAWSFLDMILWRPGRGDNATWNLRKNSVRIANRTADQVLPDGTPARFSLPDGSGVSDHWPVTVTIETE